MFSQDFVRGVHDYRWLLDRGYPENGSITLVGDRHRLSRDERHMLYRGVSSEEAAQRRWRRVCRVGAPVYPAANGAPSPERPSPGRETTISAMPHRVPLAGGVLGIDGHNVLLTIANYITGISTFECDDGLVRDIGGVHGRVTNERLMERAIRLVAATLGAAAGSVAGGTEAVTTAREVLVFLDAPVSHSKEHATRLRDALGERSVPCDVAVVASADGALAAAELACLATSDSALVDATTPPILDLARVVIDTHFSPELPSFRTILSLSEGRR